MRKSLICFLLLAGLSVGVFCLLPSRIGGEAESVILKPELLAGDLEAAQGITAEFAVCLDQHLYWDVAVHLGAAPAAEAEFTYRQERTWLETRDGEVRITHPLNQSVSGGIRPGDFGECWVILMDVAGRTAAGETREETVELRDYFADYPLRVDIWFPIPDRTGGRMQSCNWSRAGRYFQIPVPEDTRVRVRLSKNQTGVADAVELEAICGALEASSWYVEADHGLYLALGLRDEDGAFPASGGGPNYGVHYLPYSTTPVDGERAVLTGKAERVYAVDPTVPVTGLYGAPDGRLLLLTEERGDTMLTVVDPATGRADQKLTLLSGGSAVQAWVLDGCVAALSKDLYLTVLAGEPGHYAPYGGADLSAVVRRYREGPDDPGWSEAEWERIDPDQLTQAAAYWDGTRLVLAAFDGWWSSNLELLVFDAGGLACAAHLHSSLESEGTPGLDSRDETPVLRPTG